MPTNPYSCGSGQSPFRKNGNCKDDKKIFNRIILTAFVLKGTVITDEASLLAAEIAGTAFIVRGIRGTSDGGVDTTSTGFGSAPTNVDGKTVTHTITDPAYKQNYRFWNAISVSSANYDYYYFTKGYMFKVAEQTSVSAQDPLTEDVATQAAFNVTVAYTVPQGGLIEPVDFDTNQIEPVQGLFDPAAQTFVAGASPGNVAVVTGDIITVAASGAVDVTLTLTPAVVVEEAELVQGKLPGTVKLVRTSGGCKLSGAAGTVQGAYRVSIVLYNQYGVSNRKSVTINVTA